MVASDLRRVCFCKNVELYREKPFGSVSIWCSSESICRMAMASRTNGLCENARSVRHILTAGASTYIHLSAAVVGVVGVVMWAWDSVYQ